MVYLDRIFEDIQQSSGFYNGNVKTMKNGDISLEFEHEYFKNRHEKFTKYQGIEDNDENDEEIKNIKKNIGVAFKEFQKRK